MRQRRIGTRRTGDAQADASIALNRFGLGVRPGESIPSDPQGWLERQLAEFEVKPAVFAAVPTRTKVAGELADYLEQQRQLRQQGLGRRTGLSKVCAPAKAGAQRHERVAG